MRVKALVSFGGVVRGEIVSHAAGDEFELPDGADWLRVGLVAPAAAPKPELVLEPDQIGPVVPESAEAEPLTPAEAKKAAAAAKKAAAAAKKVSG